MQESEKQITSQGAYVVKEDGSKADFDISKIKVVFDRAAQETSEHTTWEEFTEALRPNIIEGMTTSALKQATIKTALDLTSIERPEWEHVAAMLLLGDYYKQVRRTRNITTANVYTPQSYLTFVKDAVDSRKYWSEFLNHYTDEELLEAASWINPETDRDYAYTTVMSLMKRYGMKKAGKMWELPQEMYLSIALFLASPENDMKKRLAFAKELYEMISQQMISLPTPTLLNARTNYHQLSSCFKLNIDDDLRAIYHGIENIAQISKFGGGVGTYLGNIRSAGAEVRGHDNASGGVTPWVKVINDTAAAVNQLGARMGAVSTTIDIWHRDVFDFLELQTETGDVRRKAYDIFPAISVPDLFMERVRDNKDWTLMDPHQVEKFHGKRLQDTYGDEFREYYEMLEKDERGVMSLNKTVNAKELFKQFLKVVVETGMPYVFFRDTVNSVNPNKHAGMIYSTQLCTEICQNTSPSRFVSEKKEEGSREVNLRYEAGDTVVCNLASVNMAKVHDEETAKRLFPVLARALDNVITLNFYPIEESRMTAMRYRPIGIGYLGLAEYLATRKIPFNSAEAREEVKKLFEMYAYHTYDASMELAKERGHYELFPGSEYSKGIVLGKTAEELPERWGPLISNIVKYGTRFGYHTAPAPNTSTAGVVGTTAALLPIYKRFFVETNLASPSVRIAPNITRDNASYYQEYISLRMTDVIDLIAEIYPWIDQSISFEWMIDPNTTSPSDLYGYYMRAWEKKIKTVYYVRSLSAKNEETTLPKKEEVKEAPAEKPKYNVCESCSG